MQQSVADVTELHIQVQATINSQYEKDMQQSAFGILDYHKATKIRGK